MPRKIKRLEWHPAALDELAENICWYAEHNPTAARRMQEEVIEAAANLVATALPSSSKAGMVNGTRELVVGIKNPFILVFTDTDDCRRIIRCRHERKNYP
jgi:plasmid stabilization system protein ParE